MWVIIRGALFNLNHIVSIDHKKSTPDGCYLQLFSSGSDEPFVIFFETAEELDRAFDHLSKLLLK